MPTPLQHALAPLLAPRSIALVGASERPGSLGRTVLENIEAGRFQGELYAVNPKRRKVLGRPAYESVAAIGAPVDLAIIATPPAYIPDVMAQAGKQLRAAAILSFPEGDADATRTWRKTIVDAARRNGTRLLGPGAFGVVRTDIGLNATFCAPIALPGRLALVSQSGAVCTSMLDFAAPHEIGFSTVTSIGAGIDVSFGELLEALVYDPATDGILMYVESVGDARAFMSALRQAARTKPVVVLKAGRFAEPAVDRDALGEPAITSDHVFDAALERAGTVRVRTYTQLFAAARILALGRIPRGERLAIVANGRGPAILAADSARDAGVTLASLSESTVRELDAILPRQAARANPIDVRGDATPARLAEVITCALKDDAVDAVLALHVPRPVLGAVEAAQAVAAVAATSRKPVLGSWLGALDRPLVHRALDTGGIANFYTPENAVEAFSFLAAYRRNQEWLLEVPSSQPDPQPPDEAEAIRAIARLEQPGQLPPRETQRLLGAFGIATAPVHVVSSLAQAQAEARKLGYPLTLTLEDAVPPHERAGIVHGRALARAWKEITQGAQNVQVAVAHSVPPSVAGACALTLTTDPVFGPVIGAGASVRGIAGPHSRTVMLPPLNRRLATDLLTAAHIAPHESLVRLLLQVSAVACALPWVRELALDPVVVVEGRAQISRASVIVDPRVPAQRGYGHMAIHPYPVELEGSITLPDGTTLAVRPVRPEDTEMERRFIASMSEQTRYFRFFYRLHELTPAMLGRFTQVDYDRELALVALAPDGQAPEGLAIVGIARYIGNLDHESAEFAVVVADAWQRRGVARELMKTLIARARRKGLRKLAGAVLRSNQGMIRFCQSLGFTVRDDPDDPEQVTAELVLS